MHLWAKAVYKKKAWYTAGLSLRATSLCKDSSSPMRPRTALAAVQVKVGAGVRQHIFAPYVELTGYTTHALPDSFYDREALPCARCYGLLNLLQPANCGFFCQTQTFIVNITQSWGKLWPGKKCRCGAVRYAALRAHLELIFWIKKKKMVFV